MFNLLPKENKKAIKTEYRLRLVVVSLIYLFVTLILASIFLIPSYVLTSQKMEIAKERHASVSGKIQTDEISTIEAGLNYSARLLKQIQADEGAYAHDIFLKIVALRQSGINLTSLSLSDSPTGKILGISGSAESRNSLASFEKRLQSEGTFRNVKLPISNFAKDADISFSITAELSKPK